MSAPRIITLGAVPEEAVTSVCARMLAAAIGSHWRQRAPEAVTAFWMDEVRAALQAAFPQLEATSGGALIAAERRRQVHCEGWTAEHDDDHTDGGLAAAAATYAFFASLSDIRRNSPGTRERALEDWPWEHAWWKPTDRIRDLTKAGALIVAEIERLQRSAAQQPAQKEPNS